ncbi:MAG: hypothetical protein WCL38_08045, partial [Actinomycetota bacterium]
ADLSQGVISINPAGWVCDTTSPNGICPPVIDGSVVYMDETHLTLTFTLRLRNLLGSRFPTL